MKPSKAVCIHKIPWYVDCPYCKCDAEEAQYLTRRYEPPYWLTADGKRLKKPLAYWP